MSLIFQRLFQLLHFLAGPEILNEINQLKLRSTLSSDTIFEKIEAIINEDSIFQNNNYLVIENKEKIDSIFNNENETEKNNFTTLENILLKIG